MQKGFRNREQGENEKGVEGHRARRKCGRGLGTESKARMRKGFRDTEQGKDAKGV